jgi:ATP dependent DNA ligase domain
MCNLLAVSAVRPTFISPCLPILARVPPNGSGWVHQCKLDGYRFLIAKHGDRVRFFSRNGCEWTHRLPALVEAFAESRPSSVAVRGTRRRGAWPVDGRGRIGPCMNARSPRSIPSMAARIARINFAGGRL